WPSPSAAGRLRALRRRTERASPRAQCECESSFSLSVVDPRKDGAFPRAECSRGCVQAGLSASVRQLRVRPVALAFVSAALVPALLESAGKPADPRALDLEYVEAHAVMRNVVPALGRAAEQAEQESPHRVVALGGKVGVEPLV